MTRPARTHYVGDSCYGGHYADAKNLSPRMVEVLQAAGAGKLYRNRFHPSRSYVPGWRHAPTQTTRALVQRGLVDRPSVAPEERAYTLTDLGRAVLEHLDKEHAS